MSTASEEIPSREEVIYMYAQCLIAEKYRFFQYSIMRFVHTHATIELSPIYHPPAGFGGPHPSR
jgi:hypothetical protein